MSNNSKWALCGSRGLPAGYGGFETFCDHFSRINHKHNNLDLIVFCDKTIAKESEYKYAERFFLPISANGFSGIFYDILSMIICIFYRRNIILLGCSGGIFIPFCRLFGIKVLTNIAGIEWGRSKWNFFAKWFLKFSESVAIKFSNKVISDNQGIAEYVLAEYGISSKVIEYGADHLLHFNNNKLLDNNFYLAIARCQSDNNISEILSSFSQTGDKLKFVSNWRDSDYGDKLFHDYKDFKNIELLDPIYDNEVIYNLRSSCIAYIHGHSAGGTNPSLIEAMMCGSVCICYDNVFNRYTTENHGYFWNTTEDLIDIIQNFNIDIHEKEIYKNIAIKRYSWSRIIHEYNKLMRSVS